MRDLPELREKMNEAITATNIQAVADAIGLHYNTIRKVANGEKDDPRYKTLKAIDKWCDKTEEV